jgi:hypothetical protein
LKNRLLTQKEVAKLFGVSENTIKNWRNRNLLSYFKAPGSSRILYFEHEVENFIDQNTKIGKWGDNYLNALRLIKKQGKPCVSSGEDWRIE